MRSPRSADRSVTTDKLELYRWAVQDPETHAIVLRTMFQRLVPAREPVVLREDFAGTSAESVAWVILHLGGRAIAVDLDGPTLEWAQRRAMRLVGPLSSRIAFVQGDVRTVRSPQVSRADIIAALNYSIFYQRDAKELVSYLKNALGGLEEDGILVFNFFGGAKAARVGMTWRHVTPKPRLSTEAAAPEFEYAWEVRSCDRESQRLDCRIHFVAPDASGNGGCEMRDAFHYDFRLWSARELMAACMEAGFSEAQLWRHTYDPAKGVDGVFLGAVKPESLPAVEKWSAYVVARR